MQGHEYQDQEDTLGVILEAGQVPGGRSPMGPALGFLMCVGESWILSS